MSIPRGLAGLLVAAAIVAPAADGRAPASTSPSQPVVVKVSDEGFHWRDAGLGAAAGIAAGLVVLGVVLTLRQAGQPGPGDARTPAHETRRSR